MNGKAATFLKQHKERVILGGVFFLFFVFVGGGFFLQSMRGSGKEPAKLAPKVVEMKLSQSGAALEPTRVRRLSISNPHPANSCSS